jgi:hypothetical protein
MTVQLSIAVIADRLFAAIDTRNLVNLREMLSQKQGIYRAVVTHRHIHFAGHAMQNGDAEILSMLLERGAAASTNFSHDLALQQYSTNYYDAVMLMLLAKQSSPLVAFWWSMPRRILQRQHSCERL